MGEAVETAGVPFAVFDHRAEATVLMAEYQIIRFFSQLLAWGSYGSG
jgi:hypothetical protein